MATGIVWCWCKTVDLLSRYHAIKYRITVSIRVSIWGFDNTCDGISGSIIGSPRKSIAPMGYIYGKRYETMVNKWWDRSDWWIVRLTKASIQRNKKWSHHWIVLCCYRREMGQGYRGLYLSPINVTNYTAYNINKLWRNEFVNWIVVTVASNHLQGPRWGRGKWLEVTVVGSTFSGLHGRLTLWKAIHTKLEKHTR